MASLSTEQQDAMSKIQYPKNWNSGNPSWNPSPLPYFNSYVNPAWGLGGEKQNGNGLSAPVNNMFTSALTQQLGSGSLPWKAIPASPGIGPIDKERPLFKTMPVIKPRK